METDDPHASVAWYLYGMHITLSGGSDISV